MNITDLLNNYWIIGIGTAVIAGLILYYVFGFGKPKKKWETLYQKSPFISSGGNISAGGDIVAGNKVTRVNKKEVKRSKSELKISFSENKVSWDKYSVGRWIWPSFRIKLELNNYNNDSAEYIKASLRANSNSGPWSTNKFIFEDSGEAEKAKPGEFRIEAGYKKKFLYSYLPSNS